mmetsp:Transcript_8341/g.25772  ORF Transcript_8341/g.25772 Transcript_8341/m.25772 type:complete len:88 (+) Transcript_8341:1965-2228(+)
MQAMFATLKSFVSSSANNGVKLSVIHCCSVRILPDSSITTTNIAHRPGGTVGGKLSVGAGVGLGYGTDVGGELMVGAEDVVGTTVGR